MTRWAVKPPVGTRLDQANSLCNGLVFAAPFNEGGGSRAWDLVSGAMVAGVDGIAANQSFVMRGGELALYGSNAGFRVTGLSPTYWDNISQITVMLAMESTRSADNFGSVCGLGATGGANAVHVAWENSSDLMYRTILNSPFSNLNPTISGITKLQRNTFAVQVGNGTKQLWTNGQRIYSASLSGVIYPYTSRELMFLHTVAGNGGPGYLWWAYVWNRVLTTAEVMQVTNEPYSMFRAPRVWMPVGLGTQVHNGAIVLPGNGYMATTGRYVALGQVGMDSVGGVVATGVRATGGNVSMASVSDLATTGKRVAVGSVTMTGTGGLLATAKRIATGVVTMVGTGTLNAVTATGRFWHEVVRYFWDTAPIRLFPPDKVGRR